MAKGCVGNQVILYYTEHFCPAEMEIEIPEGYDYDIEVLDTWKMTRQRVMTHVCDKVHVPLSGNPYMAVVARQVGKEE
nr:DUF5605 domain-containing protein [uncultured Clostridium sp.]